MLPKHQRISLSIEIKAVIRNGFSVKTPTVMAHVWVTPGTGVRFGYITGKRIGTAVTRNYTKRRFRELTRPLLGDGGPVGIQPFKGTRIDIIWRLNPLAATAEPATLERDIAKVWRRATSAKRN